MFKATSTFIVTQQSLFKIQLLNWLNQFNNCIVLDTHGYHSEYGKYEYLAAAGMQRSFTSKNEFTESLSHFVESEKDWLFGHFSYAVNQPSSNELKNLNDTVDFPGIFLFHPEILVLLKDCEVTISSANLLPASIFKGIISQKKDNSQQAQSVILKPRITRGAYIDKVTQLQQHIARGDCYEINYCQEFYATNANIQPAAVYRSLSSISPVPFSSFYKLNNKYLLCASPERFLCKRGDTLISQPIKGTSKRNLDNLEADILLKQQLAADSKEQCENVMIVDLVRNDFSRVCKPGSVKVKELFGVYTFPQVHQLISTVEGKLEQHTRVTEILKANFPPGSMTGAPKTKVMQLISQYEQSERGLYSGCVGYITPEQDFDFNVVIRSLVYDQTSQILSFHVGSAITAASIPVKEYEECMLKAAAIQKLLGEFSELP